MASSGFGSGPCGIRIPDIPDAHLGFGVDANDHDDDDEAKKKVTSA
uniref:Uncharacterized protein n=1 Tax=Moniliophthora roreri TaxID=221103 RepID=A0A0W0EWL7_MONRR